MCIINNVPSPMASCSHSPACHDFNRGIKDSPSHVTSRESQAHRPYYLEGSQLSPHRSAPIKGGKLAAKNFPSHIIIFMTIRGLSQCELPVVVVVVEKKPFWVWMGCKYFLSQGSGATRTICS